MKKIFTKNRFLFFLIMGLSAISEAGVFRITNRQYGNLDSNALPAVQTEIDNAFNLMEQQVNTQLSQFDASNYLQGVANSTALASNGITHDSANRFRYFLFSIGGGVAADLSDSSGVSSNSDVNNFSGLSGTYQMTFGFRSTLFRIPKFWVIEPERLKIYFGVASQKFKKDQLDFNFSTYSLMFQYRFFYDYRLAWGLFRWGGVQLTTGIKSSHLKILYTESFNKTQTQNLSAPGNPTLNMAFNATAQLGAETSATTIPVDVSSSIGLFYLFDLYAGVGTDINAGTTKSIISAPGSVTATETSGTLGTMSGDIEFDLGESAKSQSFVTRSFVGAALDFRIFSVGIQYTKAVSNSTQGVSLNLAAHF
jgi:hypothetical protein